MTEPRMMAIENTQANRYRDRLAALPAEIAQENCKVDFGVVDHRILITRQTETNAPHDGVHDA